jgi:TRAP-type C4-dicarboxylate transport system permease small subunit
MVSWKNYLGMGVNMNFFKNFLKAIMCLSLAIFLLIGAWALCLAVLDFFFPYPSIPYDQRFVLVACLSSVGGAISFVAFEIYDLFFKDKDKLLHKRFMTNTEG